MEDCDFQRIDSNSEEEKGGRAALTPLPFRCSCLLSPAGESKPDGQGQSPLPVSCIAVRKFQSARARRERALSLSQPANCATRPIARSRNFLFIGSRSIIKFPWTRPSRTIAPVLMMLSTILVAVPAFRRVEPATISGPVLRLINRSKSVVEAAVSAADDLGEDFAADTATPTTTPALLDVTKIVRAPISCARRNA